VSDLPRLLVVIAAKAEQEIIIDLLGRSTS
jgi:hypothetical protein